MSNKTPAKPPVEPTLPTEADYASALAQRPVPYYAGRRRIPLSWVTDVFNVESINAPSQSGGKGGGSKKGGGNSQKIWYCSIAGVVAIGPADVVLSMESDNDMVNPTWAGTSARAGDYVDLTPTDINYGGGADLLSGGRIRVYWGTESQTVDPILTGHPAYAGYTYVVLKRFLMGSSRGTPRDVNLTIARLPAVPTSIVAEASNAFSDDGTYQVNPIAVMAEIFLSPIGLGWSEDMLDATSWLAESADLWTNRQVYGQSSCFFDSMEAARNKLLDLMVMSDVVLRWLPNGKLGVVRVLPGYVPSNAATFDAKQFREAAPIKPKSQGLSGLATKVQVDFYNSDPGNWPISWKNDNVQASDQWALQTMGYVPSSLKVSRPFACGVAQAQLHGQEALRRQSVPSLTGTAHLRSAEIAVDTGGNPIQPGDKHYFDIDPAPGGTSLLALGVVVERRDFADGTVDLDLQFDSMEAVSLTLPDWSGGSVRPDPSAASLIHALIVPQVTSDHHAAAWIIATRQSTTIHGFKAFFGVTTMGDFVELGTQGGFGCRCTLVSDIGNFGTTIRFDITDGEGGPDGYIAGLTPENPTAAEGDPLLAILCYVDGNGAINNSGGLPVMEFVSLVSRTAVSTNVYDYVVLRGRQGTNPAAWDHTTAVCWIVPKGNLIKWTAPVMDTESGTGDTNWLPLASFTAGAEDQTIPLPAFAVKFPGLPDIVDGGEDYSDYFRVITGGTISVKCKERSGTASLAGCEAFASPDSPPKKFRHFSEAGSTIDNIYADPPGDCTGATLVVTTCTHTGEIQYNPTTGVPAASGGVDCVDTLGGHSNSPQGTTCPTVPSDNCTNSWSIGPTSATRSSTGVCCVHIPGVSVRKASGSGLTWTLDDEDSEDDAIARLLATLDDWGDIDWDDCTMLPCCSSTRTKRTTGFDISIEQGMVQITHTGLVVVGAYVVLRVEIWRTDLDTMDDEPAYTIDFEGTVDMSGDCTWEFLLPNEAGYTHFLNSYKFLGFVP